MSLSNSNCAVEREALRAAACRDPAAADAVDAEVDEAGDGEMFGPGAGPDQQGGVGDM